MILNKFVKPPLPFCGNKRNMLKHLKGILQDMCSYINENTIFYDVFGGSGLLSHEIKRLYPKNRVIYNDFDNYMWRLDKIEQTERIRVSILSIQTRKERAKYEKFTDDEVAEIREILRSEGDFDFITLSSWLFFSGQYATSMEHLFGGNVFYARVPYSKIERKDCLKGVEVVREDYKLLIEVAKERGDFFFVLDPPYIQTDKSHYSGFFGLADFLKLIASIKHPFIFFSSEKSEIMEFIRFLENGNGLDNFKGLSFLNFYLSNQHKGTKASSKDYVFYKQKTLF